MSAPDDADVAGGPPSTWVFSSTLSAEELARVQSLVGAHSGQGAAAADPTSTVIRGPAFGADSAGPVDAAEAAFAALVAANPGATVLDGPSAAVDAASAADAAFAAMVAANPNATVVGDPPTTAPCDLAAETMGATSALATGGDLPPGQLQAMAAMADAAVPRSAADEAAEAAAAEAAFQRMIAANPSARELAPGVWGSDE